MRRRITYANVTATLALVFAMSGGALAANHYLITSTKQIKPSVLSKLKGNAGKTGAAGAAGVAGAAGPQGPKGETGSKGEKGEKGLKGETGAAATTLWAVVESNGTLVRHGTGAIESKEVGSAGTYEVVFNQNVSQCAYTATLGSTTDGAAPAGDIGVASRAEGIFKAKLDAVYIQTYNSSGTTTAEPFHLAVFC
jgi:hypothetical protein